MKKALLINSLLIAFFLTATPVFAQSADVSKVQSFIEKITQVLVTISGSVAVIFLVVGGLRYITSSGNPEALDGAKKTIMYSLVGLAVVIGAFVLMTIVSDLAKSAFGQ